MPAKKYLLMQWRKKTSHVLNTFLDKCFRRNIISKDLSFLSNSWVRSFIENAKNFTHFLIFIHARGEIVKKKN